MKTGLAEKQVRDALRALHLRVGGLEAILKRIEAKQDVLARILKEMRDGPDKK